MREVKVPDQTQIASIPHVYRSIAESAENVTHTHVDRIHANTVLNFYLFPLMFS